MVALRLSLGRRQHDILKVCSQHMNWLTWTRLNLPDRDLQLQQVVVDPITRRVHWSRQCSRIRILRVFQISKNVTFYVFLVMTCQEIVKSRQQSLLLDPSKWVHIGYFIQCPTFRGVRRATLASFILISIYLWCDLWPERVEVIGGCVEIWN